MTKVDLITGFLGSGKTTFLKLYVKYLLKKSEKIGIIENDYGAVNVDMMLLSELSDLGCEVETIAGACDLDCHKRRFKTKLIALGMQKLDRVVIEPSGIFDVDEFFDILHEEPLDSWYEIGSVIAVADALELSALSKESSYLLASQTANAGAVVLSKTQFSDENKINEKIRQINEALKAVNCSKKLGDNVIKKNWSDFTDEDFEKIESCGYELFDYTKNALPSNAYSSLYFMNNDINPLEIREISHKLFSGKEYGSIFRIKGFLKQDENWLELNATEKQFELSPKDNGQDIIIVIGENLNEEKIKEVFKNEA
jgi:G3E family GTPase